jgi:hypothetical protein
MTMPNQNLNSISVPNGQIELPFGTPPTDTPETAPTPTTDATDAQVAAIHLCPFCGMPAPAEFCPNGHRQCTTCGD